MKQINLVCICILVSFTDAFDFFDDALGGMFGKKKSSEPSPFDKIKDTIAGVIGQNGLQDTVNNVKDRIGDMIEEEKNDIIA